MEQTEAQPEAGPRLVLGFDAGCMTCRSVAARVEKVGNGKLEIRSLRHPQMKHWREQALGEDAPWTPTLVEVDVRGVRAWTGARMVVKLTRALGVVSALRVMRAIVIAKDPNSVGSQVAPVTDDSASYGIDRGQFLRRLGTGALGVGIAASGFGTLPSKASATSATKASTHALGDAFTTAAERRQFDRAVEIMARRFRVRSDGTLQVSDARLSEAIETGKEEGIPRSIFRELTSSLGVANEQIREGELSGGSKLVSPGIQEVTEQESRSGDMGSTSERNSTRACRGTSSRSVHWWGIRMRLNSCQANTLIYYCTIEAGALSLCSRIWVIPCKVAAFILLVQCATFQRAAAPGRGIVIDKSWSLRLPRVYSQ